MILEELLGVCTPDWIQIGETFTNVSGTPIQEELLNIRVKCVTGFDDGLTVELCNEHFESKVKEAICKVYSYSMVGSGLHIVLDDENIENNHIKWCLDNSIPEIENPEERNACERCAKLLLRLKIKQRKKIVCGYGREWGYER